MIPQKKNETIESGDYLYTRRDFDTIASLIYKDAGIYLSDSKVALVYSRLTKRLRKLGISSFEEYCNLVSSPQGEIERGHMLTALTTNVTRFYREPHHFEHLANTVVPTLVTQARNGESIRIWSSACSNGQEPYSLAMCLLDAFPNVAKHDVRILATDIDRNMIAEAVAGEYPKQALSLLNDQQISKHFVRPSQADEVYSVTDEVRSLVTFNELNLNGSWPMKVKFDVIFCRNVVIYFQDDTQSKLWKRFADILKPSGHLYVGHSERVFGPASETLVSSGTTIYQHSTKST